MKPFRFSLEAIITLREHDKESALERYGKAVQQRQAKENHLKEVRNQIDTLRQDIAICRQEGKFFPSQHEAFMEELRNKENFRVKTEEDFAQALTEERRQLDKFLEAKKRLEVIVNLKNKRNITHLAQELNKEEKEVQDLFNSRYKLKKLQR